MKTTGFGYGKVILLGEHAVVYGRPAVVGALDRGVEAVARATDHPGVVLFSDEAPEPLARTGDGSDLARVLQVLARGVPSLPRGIALTTRTDLPRAVGLGSSAAFAVAIVRALARLSGTDMNDERVTALANDAEAVFHGRPSGIDVTAAAYGGLIRFATTREPERIAPARPLRLLLALVEPAPPTRDMVERVRRVQERDAEAFEAFLDGIEALVSAAVEAVRAADWRRLGDLMNRNHQLLRSLEVSTPGLDHACRAALDAGALGAKLTGAGGGGCAIVLPRNGQDEIRRALHSAGVRQVLSAEIGHRSSHRTTTATRSRR